MTIHKVLPGEKLSDIAKKYGVCMREIAEINGIENEKIALGEELLILTPTRVHTARYGDSIEKICLRYRVRKNDVLAFNPVLCEKKLEEGDRVALKYDERKHGMAVTNGYIYNGTTMPMLNRALPYMTYATFSVYSADERGLHKIFDENLLLKEVIKKNKIPLLRIYDTYADKYTDKEKQKDFCEKIIDEAKKSKYKGIVLRLPSFSHSADDYSSFLMLFKKQMIGSDLILFVECDEKTPNAICDLADGCIFSYTKLWDDTPQSFKDGEEKAIADFACNSESIKSLIDLPSFARLDDGFIDIESSINAARSNNAEMYLDENTKLLSFCTKGKKHVYPSISNIKAVLELLSEYGYMGISFDVSRTPRAFLSMFNAMFKTVNYTASVSREGCSKENNA